jgi:hypothetical protein
MEFWEIQYYDFSKLPEEVRLRICEIIYPYQSYFRKELPLEIKEIDKIDDENIKLLETVEVHKEAEDKLKKYRIEYKTFLDSLNEYHLSNYEYSYGSMIINAFPEKFTNKDELYLSVEYKEFSFQDSDYQDKFEELTDILKERQIKEKYSKYQQNVKKEVNKKPNRVKEEIDISSEFVKCFKIPVVAQEFIKILISRGYVSESENWIGLSKNPGELREAFHALEDLDLLKPGLQQLSSKKIFYNRFGLKPQGPGIKNPYISEKSLGNRNTTKDYDIFKKILEPLTNFHSL